MGSSTHQSSSDVPDTPFIVGVGASAGGLRAIEEFFDTIPCDSGAAFVVVQHLSPDYKSLMNELLERRTQMEVRRVTDGIALEANTVYLIPPGQNLVIKGTQLRLSPQDREQGYQPHFPIDLFFQSLAAEQGDRTIGIILSGTGSDGTRGIREISEAGGLVLVQDPKTAEFDGMPQSAIATGMVDLALSPSELAQTTYEFITTPSEWQQLRHDQQNQVEPSQIQQIVNIVKNHADIDFTHYKPSSISRRIRRRCLIAGYPDLDSYTLRLEDSEAERDALRNDLLITVTRFFRDTYAWQVLETQILPELIENVDADTPIRVWIAACATGEEAYSMAILLRELLDDCQSAIEAKIFATDIDPIALEKASAGIYPASIRNDLSEQRLEKFFTERNDGFEVSRSIREMIIFANHNLAKDAGFTNMDIVTCRNVLIYMQSELQQRVLRSLHFALKVKGILFLGESETLATLSEEFVTLQRKWKLYQKRRNVRLPLPPSDFGNLQVKVPNFTYSKPSPPSRFDPLIEVAFQTLLDHQDATCLLVDRHNQLIHVCGDRLNLLRIPGGRASQDVLKMLPDNLQLPISTALYQARQKREKVEYRGCQITNPVGETHTVTITTSLHPANRTTGEFSMILVKKEPTQTVNPPPGQFEASAEAAQYVLQLEYELQQTRENLQATIEELETTDEEQQATNEELIASNEELQSTNEELHSVNEELYTVNAEYQAKIQELLQLNNDLDNLLSNTNIGVIFLDKDDCIRKFTPAATQAFNLVKADIGRPLLHLSHNLEDFDLTETLTPFKQDLQPQEIEVKFKRQPVYLSMRILPYINENQEREGILLILIDISEIKQTQHQLEAAEAKLLKTNERLEQQVKERTAELETSQHFLESITQSSPNYIYIYDLIKQSNVYVNRSLGQVLGYSPEALSSLGKELKRHIFHPDDLAKIAAHHQAILTFEPNQDQIFEIEYRVRDAHGDWRWWYSQEIVYALSSEGTPSLLLGMAIDIDDRKRAEAQLKASEANYRNLYKKTPVMLHSINSKGELISVSDYWLACLGYERDDVIGQPSTQFLTPDSQTDAAEVVLPEYFKTGTCTNVPYQMVRKDGSVIDVLISATAERDDNGDIVRSLAVIIDVTERNQTREELTRYRDQLETLINDRTEEIQKTNQRLQAEIKERQQIEQELAKRATDLAVSNAGLEQFAYVVSHDLQEPLRAMTVFSQLLHQRYEAQLDDSAKNYIDNIVKGGIRMKAMIDGILALSRITKKTASKTIVPVNLQKPLDMVLENLKVICAQRQAIITQDPLPTMVVEQNHMVQLFQNLIANAIKFCNSAPEIHIIAQPQPQGYVFGVQDNGPGISEQDQERIFQLFQRLHTRQEHDGYGIGLAICQKIVQHYDGRLWLESEPHQGSVFYFTLAPDQDGAQSETLTSEND